MIVTPPATAPFMKKLSAEQTHLGSTSRVYVPTFAQPSVLLNENSWLDPTDVSISRAGHRTGGAKTTVVYQATGNLSRLPPLILRILHIFSPHQTGLGWSVYGRIRVLLLNLRSCRMKTERPYPAPTRGPGPFPRIAGPFIAFWMQILTGYESFLLTILSC